MFIQGKGDERFKLMTSASLGVVYSRLNYPLETIFARVLKRSDNQELDVNLD
jgi:hypothetical protein